MSYFKFLSVPALKQLSTQDRNDYLDWIITNGGEKDGNRYLASVLKNETANGDWSNVQANIDNYAQQIQKGEDTANEYAQRVKEYNSTGTTGKSVDDWGTTAKTYLGFTTDRYNAAPSFVKGEAPPTYDSLLSKLPAVNPYDTAGGVVYDKEKAAGVAGLPGTTPSGTPTYQNATSPDGGYAIPFISDAQEVDKAYLSNLVATKDPATWTDQEKQNWAALTNASPLPSAGSSSGAASTYDSGVDMTGWPDSAKQAYQAYKGYVDKVTSNGQIVNPDIKIDDTLLQRFTDQAKTELAPYYGQLFSQAEADLKNAGEQIAKDYSKNVRDIGFQYGNKLESTQESLAARGLGLGEYRNQQEQKVKSEADTALQDAADAASTNAMKVGTAGERLLGSGSIGGFDPNVTTGQTLNLGSPGVYGLTSGTGTRSLFSGVGSTTGTLEASQLNAEETRKQDLINNERGLRALNYL